MKKVLLILLTASLIILPACSKQNKREFFAMDAYMTLSAYCDEKLLSCAEEKIKALDAKFSITGAMGEVFLLNQNGVLSAPSAELTEILNCAKILYERTGGAYDITSYPLKRLWQSCESQGRKPTDAEISASLAVVGMNKLSFNAEAVSLTAGGSIDLGSIVKGYAGREAVKIFKNGGASGGVLDLGGNIATFGKKPDGQKYKIGITDPNDPENICGYVTVGESNVVTSGGYNRYMTVGGEKFNHIIDARTGMPCNNGVASVTVICEDGMWADALSTALFLLGEQGALDYYKLYGGFEAVMIMEDGRVITTSDAACFVSS